MTADEFATWDLTPDSSSITAAAADQVIDGINNFQLCTSGDPEFWFCKAQPSESFDGQWDTQITSVYDWRIDIGDTIFAKVYDWDNNGQVLVEADIIVTEGASSLINTAIALIGCIVAYGAF